MHNRLKRDTSLDCAESSAIEKALAQPQRTMWGIAWLKFRQHRIALLASVVLVTVAVACVFARVSSHNPNAIDLAQKFQPPSRQHLWGTDELGRDMLTRVLYGGRMSLVIGICAMAVGLVTGTVVGCLAGYYGGFVDGVLMRLTDAALAFPSLFLLILVGAMLRETPFGELGGGVPAIVIVLGAFSWMTTARLVRAAFLSLRETEFVVAAHSCGAGDIRVMVRHILPNALGPILVAGTLEVGYAILTESGLSFLGFGVKPPTPTWGNMLTYAQQYMTRYPWVAVFPGMMIFITITAINYVGDGLRDALDPYKVLTGLRK